MSVDSYKTIASNAEGPVFKDRKSKFIGFALPVPDRKAVGDQLEKLRSEHPGARHICYAWIIGVENAEYRANDDGEPHNSAGQPILGQIRALELTNVLVAVARYYGGTKLGVGGLINAYRTAARNALEAAEIVKQEVQEVFQLQFGYELTGKVLHLLGKNQWEVRSRQMSEHCHFSVGVRKGDVERFEQIFGEMKNITLERATYK